MDIIILFKNVDIVKDMNLAPDKNFPTNGELSMSLVRVNSSELIPYECVILGTYEEVFADAEKKAIYESIYQREYSYEDEEGNTVIAMKPERFGEFA